MYPRDMFGEKDKSFGILSSKYKVLPDILKALLFKNIRRNMDEIIFVIFIGCFF
jgi:hypothetical protein